MMRSLVFPGWGQFENRAWLKAVALGGADAYLRVRSVSGERRLRRLETQVNQARDEFNRADQVARAANDELQAALASGDPQRIAEAQAAYDAALAARGAANMTFNSLAGSYNTLVNAQVARLWLLGGVLAYAMVDAYVDAHFRNFKLEFEYDPALPGGKPASGRTRLFLRWAF
jgi:hypothetical protein